MSAPVGKPAAFELGLAGAARICASLEPPLRVEHVRRLAGGSVDVFEMQGEGRRLVAKIYADEPAWKPRKEAFVAGLYARAGVAEVPRWLAIDESRALLPRRFAVMTRLPGEILRTRFGNPDAERLFREMGDLLYRMSAVAMPHHGYLLADEVATPFDTNLERMAVAFEAKYRDYRDWGGDAALLAQIEAYVTARFAAFGECGPPVLCHNDFHPGNLLVAAGADGEQRISGVIDFENAIAGDPLWDLAKALDFTAHECPAGRAPLEAGYREAGPGALDRPGAEEALTLYRIFHKFELISFFKSLHIQAQGAAALITDLTEMTARG